jgi:serine/threonine protein kinase
VQGPTLASLLHLDGTLPPYLAVDYAAQIADALDVAYKECHVIHRDIKPENLMLDRRGRIKVMDFGLARAPGLQRITVARTLVGSIYYSSPEQVWGYTLDNRSDIYALGVVLYEMVCGHRPFSGRSMLEVTQAITGGPLHPPRFYNAEIPSELEQIILTALARDRDQRYAEADQFAQALRALKLTPEIPTTPVLVEQGQTSMRLVAHAAQGRTIAHPPKRPQVQRPDYFAIDLQKTQPLHDEPAAPPDESQRRNTDHMDGPTRPLDPLANGDQQPNRQRFDNSERTTASLISLPKRPVRQSIWRQLQRLLRPSSH